MTAEWIIPVLSDHFAAANAYWLSMLDRSLAVLSSDAGGIVIAVVYIAMIFGERVIYLFAIHQQWDNREAHANILSSLFVAVAEALLTGGIFFVLYQIAYDHLRLFDISFSGLMIVVMFFANDLCHYIDHRMQHRISLLWAIHIAHHSSTDYNVLVANRGSVLQFGLLTSPVYLLLPILGFPLSLFLFVKFFGNVWGTFSHTKLINKMGIFDNIFSTPSNHRVHHGTNKKYIDKNYGQVLIIWDRLFATYQREEEYPNFGLVSQMPHRGIWHIQTHGVSWLRSRLATADSLPQIFALAFKPPEWSPAKPECMPATESALTMQAADDVEVRHAAATKFAGS